MDDSELIGLFLKRDETAVAIVKRQYGPRLRAIAFGIVHNEWTAEECEQDAVLDAWNSIPPHEPYGYLFAYLARIVRSRAIDRLAGSAAAKRSAVLVELSDELADMLPSGGDAAEQAEANELMRHINAFLGRLSVEKRDVFVRRYWFMDSIPDIARMTGSGESRIKMMLMRTRKQLREYLNRHGYDV